MKLHRSVVLRPGFFLLLVLIISLAACSGQAKSSDEGAKPSNPGGPGEAVDLTGDAANGATIFEQNCVSCHGEEGKGGVSNPGAAEPTVPELNPMDETIVNADYKTFATNIDLFIEHGSTAEGDSPTLNMLKFGDDKILTPQQIADVIAYVISLNK